MQPLVQAIVDTSVPTVVVFSSGKPITGSWIENLTASLLQQFYPSQEGGHALADIFFGGVSPSGKLSVSWPRNAGDLPVYYDYMKSGTATSPGFVGANGNLHFGHHYVLGDPTPLFEFGFGLSYTSFSYTNMQLSSTNTTATDTVQVCVDVKNKTLSMEQRWFNFTSRTSLPP